MNKVLITKVKTSKQSVKTNEKITIQVFAYSATDNIQKRLPFTLGGSKTIKV